MRFISIYFFFFMLLLLCGYYIVPQRYRYIFLLACNILYYLSWVAAVADIFPIAAVTVVTWFGAALIERIQKPSRKKAALILTTVICVGLLVYYKYTGFLLETYGTFFHRRVISSHPSIIMPLGISFFTFQSLSYVFEVYRQNVQTERNLLYCAAYVAFFPTVMSGPIERPGGLLRQIRQIEAYRFRFDDFQSGLLFVLYGGFVKYVVSERFAIIVNTVFDSYESYGMTILVFAAICYALQIYCDFSSYSLMAVGLGKMMGFRLTENFRQPYFAASVQEFWRRWHISLSTWFRDYVYIPLGGNRCSAWRKNFNLFLTFLVSGIWHGSNWTFVVWGCIHGVYQIVGNITSPLREKLYQKYHVKTGCFSFRLGQRLCTFTMVTAAWIFFRSDSLSDAVKYIGRIATEFDIWNLFNNSIYNLGLSILEMNILTIGLAAVFAIDCIKYRTDKDINSVLAEQNWGFRGLVFILLFVSTLVFGMYGPAFDAQSFIYFQF